MMSMTGHQSAAAKIFAVSALFSVILNLTLIPWLGIIGAVIANLMGQMIWNFTILVFLRSRLGLDPSIVGWLPRSEEHTSELQSLMRISYVVFCLKIKKTILILI